MRYYSEEEMKDLRLALENEILKWDKVVPKKMFGCPCYDANKKLFAFVATNRLVIIQLSAEDRELLQREYNAQPFGAGPRKVKSWSQVPFQSKEDLKKLLPFVKKSYANALAV